MLSDCWNRWNLPWGFILEGAWSETFGVCFHWILSHCTFYTTWGLVRSTHACDVLVVPDSHICSLYISFILLVDFFCSFLQRQIYKHPIPPASCRSTPSVRGAIIITLRGLDRCITCGAPWNYGLFCFLVKNHWWILLTNQYGIQQWNHFHFCQTIHRIPSCGTLEVTLFPWSKGVFTETQLSLVSPTCSTAHDTVNLVFSINEG